MAANGIPANEIPTNGIPALVNLEELRSQRRQSLAEGEYFILTPPFITPRKILRDKIIQNIEAKLALKRSFLRKWSSTPSCLRDLNNLSMKPELNISKSFH